MNTILHIDMNSFFASVEQQANPKLRGKPIGVTGGDRETRTVLCTASYEAKKMGVKTGMQIWEAKKICPDLIIIQSNHDKYLSVTTKFLNIFKDYTDKLEVFSIDEAFLEVTSPVIARSPWQPWQSHTTKDCFVVNTPRNDIMIAQEIKQRLKDEIGECITCSIGISYNKLMAKLAGSLKKPDGLVIIPDQKEAIKVLDKIELDDICGIGPATKKRLFNMGITDFRTLRKVPKSCLVSSFKSYGEILYNMARGIDHSPIKTFFEKDEVKSIGHRLTIDHDTSDLLEIKQILLKLCELVGNRLRAKKLSAKTIHCWYRNALSSSVIPAKAGIQNAWIPGQARDDKINFTGNNMQITILPTSDGLQIFKTAWEIFQSIWNEDKIRMIGISVSNLKPDYFATLSLLPETRKQETMQKAIDKINNKYGDFTLQRAVLLKSTPIKRTPNPFLSDRRFKI
ncbi:MAG: DNA polymerase IV [Candidatus Daviesbacteria bacterium]|nr:DNA polymerase IV [Candidatus Daviesbacteria bacterium]